MTPNRWRPVENDEYASFIRRVIRAYARPVAAGDADALADMTGFATVLDDAIGQAVTGLRGAGYSWSEIAAGSTSLARRQSSDGASGNDLRSGQIPGPLRTTRYARTRPSRT